MHVQDAARLFLEQLEADGRAQSTRDQQDRHLKLLIAWLESDSPGIELEQIAHQHIARFFTSDTARLRADGRQKRANSLNCLRSSVRGLFRYVHQAGITTRNPAALLRRAIVSRPPPRAMPPNDVATILAVMRKAKGTASRRDHCLFSLLAGTGARISAVLAIEVADVDLDAGEILLRRCKAGREEVLYVPRRVRGELARFIGSRTRGPLFAGPSGRPLTRRHAHRRLQLWLARAGIERKYAPHSLRHGFALRLYERTHDLLLVQAALHHASVVSTIVYARCDERRLRKLLG